MGSLWPALVLMAGLVAAAGQAAASDPAAWTNVRVQRWARELPLPKDVADQFAARLEKEDYTGADLMGMDKDEMRELGITKMGQLKRIAAAVAKLQTKQAPDPADSGASKEDWELEAKLEQERAAARVLEAELKLERDARHKAELEKERDARRQAEAGTAERLMEAQRAAERGREEAAERGARERADVRNGKDRYDSRADRQESADRRSSAHSEHVEREAGAGRQQSERSESRHERGMEREANAKRQHSADEGNAQRQRTYSEEYAVFGIGGTKGFTELPWFLTWYPILVACFLSGTRSFLLLGLFLASYAILIKRIGDDTADDVMSLNFFAWGFFNCFLLWVMLNPTTTGSDTFRAPNTAAHAAPVSAPKKIRQQAPAGAVLCVEGAGTAQCNGYYKEDDTFNGKPRYRHVEDWHRAIYWYSGTYGVIGNVYLNRKDSATPPSDGWEVFRGRAPAPRLRWL